MSERLTIRKPDDWHVHVRDGAMLKACLPFTASHFGRAILMPNLTPPVLTAADAAEAFASRNGPMHYRLPLNQETITLEKSPWTAPEEMIIDGPEERAMIYRGDEPMAWRVVPHGPN